MHSARKSPSFGERPTTPTPDTPVEPPSDTTTEVDAAAGPDAGERSHGQFVLWAVVVALVGALLAVGIARINRERAANPIGAHQGGSLGTLAVALPPAAIAGEFRTTMLRYGEIARSGGKTVDRLTPEEIGATGLEPGIYVTRFTYRNRKLPDTIVRVTPGAPTTIRPSARDLAEAEYATGLANDLRGITGVDHFRRTVELDPGHVKGHLQLAAYELLYGSPRAVEDHLEAIRRVDPDNPEAKRVEQVLRRRLARSR